MPHSTGNSVYVVTGGNRGIGLGLVTALIARTSTTVVCTVRNSEAAAAVRSQTTTLGEGSSLYILQLDFSNAVTVERIREVFTAATSNASIDHVDVLMCNAGFSPPLVPTAETSAEDLRESFETNTIAPLMVFQAFWPLMQKSAATPKLVVTTSSVASMTQMEPVPGGAYGPTKAALNWITKSLHHQHERLIAIALHPGWVKTRMGILSAKSWGFAAGPPVTIEDSVKGTLQLVDGATKDTVSGKFVTYNGELLPW